MSEHVSDLELDALRLGRGSEAVARHVEGCARCAARRAELEAAAEDFSARFSPAVLATETLLEVERRRGRRRWTGWWGGAAGLAMAAAVLFTATSPPDEVRAKGEAARVELFEVRAGTPTITTGPVDARATLRVRVRTEGPRFVRLLWSSTPHAWTALYPGADAPSWPVDGVEWLRREVELDGALETETLGVVFCEGEVSSADAARALEGEVVAGCEAVRRAVEKR